MKNLKRDCVKYIRDRAKSRYKKGVNCYICGADQNLDFHHFYSLTPLLNRWILKNGLDPDDVLEFRDRFIEEHNAELFNDTVTICRSHHQQLHSIYGKHPSLGTAKKQKRWVSIQREKHGTVD